MFRKKEKLQGKERIIDFLKLKVSEKTYLKVKIHRILEFDARKMHFKEYI